jgi:hypothetical protein
MTLPTLNRPDAGSQPLIRGRILAGTQSERGRQVFHGPAHPSRLIMPVTRRLGLRIRCALGALGGTRTPNLLIRRSVRGVR